MPVPENAQAIYTYLTGAGLNANAAAGILGNIEQESGGNPAAGGNPPGSGLIQQLGFPSTDTLEQNEAAIITYIKANGSIAAINAAATSPSAAALYFSENYEKPDAALANNANREASAEAVAAAAKSGNWPAGSASPAAAPTTDNSILSFPSQIVQFFTDADSFVNKLVWITTPGNWVRIAAFLAGTSLLLIAFYALIAIGEGSDSIFPKMPTIMPVPV